MLSLLVMLRLSLLPMLMRMLLCTVITMVDTILIATLLTDIPLLTLATGIPSTITTARGLLMLSPTVDTTDMDTIAVKQQTQQRRRNFTNQVHCLCYPAKALRLISIFCLCYPAKA